MKEQPEAVPVAPTLTTELKSAEANLNKALGVVSDQRLTIGRLQNAQLDAQARIAALEAALNEIADKQKVYLGGGDYSIVPMCTADQAQAIARKALAGGEVKP